MVRSATSNQLFDMADQHRRFPPTATVSCVAIAAMWPSWYQAPNFMNGVKKFYRPMPSALLSKEYPCQRTYEMACLFVTLTLPVAWLSSDHALRS